MGVWLLGFIGVCKGVETFFVVLGMFNRGDFLGELGVRGFWRELGRFGFLEVFGDFCYF